MCLPWNLKTTLSIPLFLPSMILIFLLFLTMLFQTKKIRRRTQKKYLIKNTMNLDDEYISWSLSEVFSPSWITWCYKLKCIGCIHHVITACTKPKIQEDKLGCYDVGGVGWQVCADAGFFSKVYCCCWESSPLDGDFLIFTLFGFLFWTR